MSFVNRMVPTPRRVLGNRLRSRAGFALGFTLVFMLLLMVYLVAAQGSVESSRHIITRSGQRQLKSQIEALILNEAVQSLKSGAAIEIDRAAFVLRGGLHPKVRVDSLEAGAAEYGRLPGISHRNGDALVTINWIAENRDEQTQYLINGRQRRSGTIRVK